MDAKNQRLTEREVLAIVGLWFTNRDHGFRFGVEEEIAPTYGRTKDICLNTWHRGVMLRSLERKGLVHTVGKINDQTRVKFTEAGRSLFVNFRSTFLLRSTLMGKKNSGQNTSTKRSGNGLRAWQVRILGALSKAKGPMNRSTISEKARTHPSNQTNVWGIGLVDAKKRAAAEKKSGIPSLLTLKFVRQVEVDVDGRMERCYEITAAGKKALTAALANANGKK